MAGSAVHESFLRHARFRDMKLALLLCLLAIALYVWDEPVDGANGGTWLGYGLGGLGAFIIVLLSLLGVRKRRYRSRLGTVKGWLSLHVYLGLSLLVIATLHTGFQFGLNIHSLAYVLMVVVILSGLYGIVAYSRYPAAITAAQGSGTREQWIAEVFDLNEEALKLADRVSPQVHAVVVRSCERQKIGGSLRQQLFGIPPPRGSEIDKLRLELEQRGEKRKPAFDPNQQSTVMFMASQVLKDGSDENRERLQKLLELLGRRNELVRRINQDIVRHARMQVWLFLHVPLTVALLAALIAHIVSVFLYW